MYSLLTYIFKNGDKLREAPKVDGIEYICVTDNPDLKSDTWKIIVDEDLKDKGPLYASFYVRYHPFKYCSGDIVMRIDGSIEIKESLLPIFEEFDKSGKDICVMTNSRASSLMRELSLWPDKRHALSINSLKTKCKELGITFKTQGCIQSPISITRNNELCNKCDALTWSMIEQLSTPECTARPSQGIQTLAIYMTKDLDIMFVDESLIQSNYMQWHHHNIDSRRRTICIGFIKQTEFFGTPIVLHKFKGLIT